LTGAIAGARDAAIRQNEPRGIRLVPDPTLTQPALGTAAAGSLQLAYNRIVPIEPAPDYIEGKINIGPALPFGASQNGFPSEYPRATGPGQTYPYFPSDPGVPSRVLMIEESIYSGGFAWQPGSGGLPNPPVNWYWNIRVGDKIKVGGTGRALTVVGPCVRSPWTTGDNPELFVNVGPPGTLPPLTRTYCTVTAGGFAFFANGNPEFLFLVNGEDDDHDGFVDAGWDGFDGNATGLSPPDKRIDDLSEWEVEIWPIAAAAASILDSGPNSSNVSPSNAGTNNWLSQHWQDAVLDQPYSIQRRPVPTAGAREVLLPAGVVVDATSWSMTQERSRLPVDPASLFVDIMLNPSGQVIPTTVYSAPTSASPIPFLHFWLADRNDVYPVGAVWGLPTPTNPAPPFLLPMDVDAAKNDPNNAGYQLAGPGHYPPASALPAAPMLKGDRRLITINAKSGMVVTNTLDTIPHTTTDGTILPGEGFNIDDPGQPFYKAQFGQREVK
jgi:hypothetical protein